jgi:hypothetical protein
MGLTISIMTAVSANMPSQARAGGARLARSAHPAHVSTMAARTAIQIPQIT